MSERSVDNFSREELLALVHEQQRQIEALQRQLMQQAAAGEAGSIAQAALELSGIFETAQQAADVYLESVEDLKARQEADYHQRLAQAEEQCRAMLARAEQGAQFYWDALSRRIEELMAAQPLPQAEPAGEPAAEPSAESFGPDD